MLVVYYHCIECINGFNVLYYSVRIGILKNIVFAYKKYQWKNLFQKKTLKDMSTVPFLTAPFKDFFIGCWKYRTKIHKQLMKYWTYHERTSVKLCKMLAWIIFLQLGVAFALEIMHQFSSFDWNTDHPEAKLNWNKSLRRLYLSLCCKFGS